MPQPPARVVELRVEGRLQRIARETVAVRRAREHAFPDERLQSVEERVPFAVGHRGAHLERHRPVAQAQRLPEPAGLLREPADARDLGVEPVRRQRVCRHRLGENPRALRVRDDALATEVLRDVERVPGVSSGTLVHEVHEPREVLHVAEHGAKELGALFESTAAEDERRGVLAQSLNGQRELGVLVRNATTVSRSAVASRASAPATRRKLRRRPRGRPPR